ncbi:hypothetical protein HBB16_01505 [Pseudonocardia sp. MCCB 268]|nr:hypothetical protein [Pseudonocardia cytotoxica]
MRDVVAPTATHSARARPLTSSSVELAGRGLPRGPRRRSSGHGGPAGRGHRLARPPAEGSRPPMNRFSGPVD